MCWRRKRSYTVSQSVSKESPCLSKNQLNSPASALSSSRLGILLVRDGFVKMLHRNKWVLICWNDNLTHRVREGSHAPLLLADSLLSVPALEEDLLRVWVKEADHPEVCDNLGPGYVQLYTGRASIQCHHGNARMKLSRKVMQIIARVGKTELWGLPCKLGQWRPISWRNMLLGMFLFRVNWCRQDPFTENSPILWWEIKSQTVSVLSL